MQMHTHIKATLYGATYDEEKLNSKLCVSKELLQNNLYILLAFLSDSTVQETVTSPFMHARICVWFLDSASDKNTAHYVQVIS